MLLLIADTVESAVIYPDSLCPIQADGFHALDAPPYEIHQDGVGGGGGGGTLIFWVRHLKDSLCISARGGNGGNTHLRGAGPGGGGGGGAIWIPEELQNNPLLTVHLEGGRGGYADTSRWGSQDGQPGHLVIPDSFDAFLQKHIPQRISPDIQIQSDGILFCHAGIPESNTAQAWECQWQSGTGNAQSTLNSCVGTLLLETGGYVPIRLQVTTSDRCVLTWDTFLWVKVPTAFSPDQDGRFDRWILSAPPGYSLNVQIVTRWGTPVFICSGASVCIWDGTCTAGQQKQNCPEGIYYFTAVLTPESPEGPPGSTLRGSILLQRSR